MTPQSPTGAPAAAWRACIDIGGSKLAVSLNPAGTRELRARHSEPTATTGAPDAVARQVLRLLDAACAQAGVAAASVTEAGVSTCGPFVRHEGLLALAAPNLCGGLARAARRLPNDWRLIPLEAVLRGRFTRLRIENDGIAALEAERRWGALQGLDHCAYVTWSTGIGFGLCVDGRLLRGKHGNAGHAGHIFVSDDQEGLCGCGNLGDLEGLVAGHAIERRFGVPPARLLADAEGGDAAALERVDGLCRLMGRALYNLCVTLDLQRVSLGGSVFLHHQALLLPRLRAQLAGRLPALTDGCELVAAGLGDRVGDYAALALLA